MSLGYGVVQLDVTIVNTALNAIGMSLGGGVSELQWVVSAYTIAFAAFILTAGALGDRTGANRFSWRALRSLPRHRSPARWRRMLRS
jgi:MFS transporter, DHA2 family, methylenomycin A resistance protein